MNKNYLEPEIEVIKFDFDVILSSSEPVEITDEDGVQWSHYY